jgi:hypothetical protein
MLGKHIYFSLFYRSKLRTRKLRGAESDTSLQYNAPIDVGAHGTELLEIGDHRVREEWLGVSENGSRRRRAP